MRARWLPVRAEMYRENVAGDGGGASLATAGADRSTAEPYTLRTTPSVRRAFAGRLPESVAVAAYRFTYRIIYRVDDATRTVTVVDVDHRRDVYRPEAPPVTGHHVVAVIRSNVAARGLRQRVTTRVAWWGTGQPRRRRTTDFRRTRMAARAGNMILSRIERKLTAAGSWASPRSADRGTRAPGRRTPRSGQCASGR